MVTKIFALLFVSILFASFVMVSWMSPAHAENSHKVELCHFPPGNPNNPFTIVVDSHSVAHHLANGDCLGKCVDSDGDGVVDCKDGCPSDPNKTDPGYCGCGIPDADQDGDGYYACVKADCDHCNDCDDDPSHDDPNNPTTWAVNIHPGAPDPPCDGIDSDCSQQYGGCEPKTGCPSECKIDQNTPQECGQWNAGCGVFVACGTDTGDEGCSPLGQPAPECSNGKCCLPNQIFNGPGGECGTQYDDGCGKTRVIQCIGVNEGPSYCNQGICSGSAGTCNPIDCTDKPCGTYDGCGGFCKGTCPTGETCEDFGNGYVCSGVIPSDFPKCSDLECGHCLNGSQLTVKSCPTGEICANDPSLATIIAKGPIYALRFCKAEPPSKSDCFGKCNDLEYCDSDTGQCECCYAGNLCSVCGANEVCSIVVNFIGFETITTQCCDSILEFCY